MDYKIKGIQLLYLTFGLHDNKETLGFDFEPCDSMM